MKSAKDIALVGVCAALLIGGQMALHSISGVEVVTVMLLCFSFSMGAARGMAAATVFSLLRCFIFGFYPNVMALYLIYYNLFALFFGWLGVRLEGKKEGLRLILCAASAVVLTSCFTLLDDVLTPLIYGFSPRAARTYFFASLYAMVTQMICSAVTVTLLFAPLTRLLRKVR